MATSTITLTTDIPRTEQGQPPSVRKKLNAPDASGFPVKKSNISVEMESPAFTSAPSVPAFCVEKEELYDTDAIQLIAKDEAFAKDIRTKLNAYNKDRTHGGRKLVKYYFGKGCEGLQIGRVFATNYGGISAFPHDIRNALTAKWYWDIDMENCHYWIMRTFCKKNGLKCDMIDYYCQNREAMLARVSSNRKVAKTAFLKVAYGGNIRLQDIQYDTHIEDDGEEAEGDITIIKDIEKEIATIIKYVKGAFPLIHKVATDICKKKKEWADKKGKWIHWNADYSALALTLQTEERKCLQAIDDYFASQGRQMDILIHDGGLVRKVENETEFPSHLLRGAEEAVMEKLGYEVKLAQKPIHYVPREPLKTDIYDDEYASRRFVELMGDFIKREEDIVYYFNPDTGMWETGKTAFRCAVARHKTSLIFRVVSPEGERIYNYGGSEKNVSAMEKWITTCVPNGRFISDNMDTSFGKLLFKNGIYDFITNEFTEGFNPKIVFNKRITRNYNGKRDEALIMKVEKLLFKDAFDESDGKLAGQYLKKALCMGIVGDYRRKKFYACLGESNCGKGLTTYAFSKTFEGYVGEWNANELKYNPRNGHDLARQLGWLRSLVGCRLAFSNEFRMDRTPIDGNLLKAISSGGDEIKGRRAYEAESGFVNRASMFLMANDFGNITPKDSGIQERCRFIRYRLRFVMTEPTPHTEERKADPEAKEYFDKDEYRDALFWVMVDTYQSMKKEEKCRFGVIDEPDCVKEETKDWVGDDGGDDFEVFLKRRYDITGNKDDVAPSKEIVEYIMNDCKMTSLSANKIGRLLTKLIQSKNKDCPRDRVATQSEEEEKGWVGKLRQGIKQK